MRELTLSAVGLWLSAWRWLLNEDAERIDE